MTVIAWDGTTLAADKQGTTIGYATRTTKIFRIDAGLVAFSGCAIHAAEMLMWFRGGMVHETFPKYRGDSQDGGAGSLLITNDGEIRVYGDCSPFYEVLQEKFHARGAGRDYALAAMYLGKNAREAVEVACALDITCGKGIDTLTLKE